MQKSKMALQIAELEKQLVEGGSDMLQLMNLLAFCMRQMSGPKA